MDIVASVLTAVAVAALCEPARALWISFSRYYFEKILDECKSISYEMPALDAWLTFWGVSIVACLVAGLVAMKPLLGLNAAFIVFVIPKQILLALLRKRKMLLKTQLVSALSLIGKTVKTGRSLEQTFASVGKEIDPPMGREFKRMAFECNRGRTFEKVLEESKERIKIPEYSIFIVALITNKKRGGDVVATLEEIRKSLMESQRLDRKLAADTATGRLTINTLALTPLAFVGLTYMLSPEGTGLLFSEILGNCVLLVVTALTYVGYRWGQRIVEVEF